MKYKLEKNISGNIYNLEYIIQKYFLHEHIINLIKIIPNDFYKQGLITNYHFSFIIYISKLKYNKGIFFE